ncbi:MAG: glycosyl transferase, partial [Cytophagales bacterium]|nr:glycosyl transferase [Cytophagales bacterium]
NTARNHGASRVPWLSGSATWTYYAISQYVLGVRPEYDGLSIDPCVPSSWDGFTAERIFRGKQFKIKVSNPNRVQKGVVQLRVNGQPVSGFKIGLELMQEHNEVEVVMG